MNKPEYSLKRICRSIFVLFALFSIYETAYAYNGEYFWNVDPGFGKATKISSSGTSDRGGANFDISASGLKPGINIMGVRVMVDGRWSTTITSPVVIPYDDSTYKWGCEYFWDKDPGYGKAIQYEVDLKKTGGIIEPSTISKDLTPGEHTLGVRVNYAGNWSATTTTKVIVPYSDENFTWACEYFWDKDPGYGNGIPCQASLDKNGGMVDATISTEELSIGEHTLGVRTNYCGNWSATTTSKVIVGAEDSQVVGAEYFWGKDPGYGNGTPITITPGKEVEVKDLEIPMPENREGEWALTIRARSGQAWGHSYTKIFKFNAVEGVKIDKSEASLPVGATTTLSAIFDPIDAFNNAVTWSSSNSNIAKVDDKGIVTAIKPGEAIITTTTNEGNFTATCKITVADKFDNYMCINNKEANVGTTVEFPVMMNNIKDISAFQCDIHLAEGITISKRYSEYDISLNGNRGTGSHTIASKEQTDGAVRVLSYSSKSEAFNNKEGELFKIMLTVPENMPGKYAVKIDNIRLSDTKANEYIVPDIMSDIIVSDYKLGDSNGDNSVTIVDAVNTSNYTLGEIPPKFIFKAADVNMDKAISITDVVGTVNIVLNPLTSIKTMRPLSIATNDKMSIEDFSIVAGETKDIEIEMTNATAYTAFQLDLYLPDGLSIVTEDDEYLIDLTSRKAKSHTIAANGQTDGAVRIVAYSSKNANFNGNSGGLVTIKVKADASFTGAHEIIMKKILLATSDAIEYEAPEDSATVTGTSSIDKTLNGSMMIYSFGKILVIKSPIDQLVPLTSISGLVEILDVKAGVNKFEIDNEGIYIVGRKKIIIK